MKLLYFEGNLKIGQCCARPDNAVRFAKVSDIIKWIDTNDAWDEVINAKFGGKAIRRNAVADARLRYDEYGEIPWDLDQDPH